MENTKTGGSGSESITVSAKLTKEASEYLQRLCAHLTQEQIINIKKFFIHSSNNRLKIEHKPMRRRLACMKRRGRCKRKQVKQGKFRNKRHGYT